MGNSWCHIKTVDLKIEAIIDHFGNAAHSALSFPVLDEDVLIVGSANRHHDCLCCTPRWRSSRRHHGYQLRAAEACGEDRDHIGRQPQGNSPGEGSTEARHAGSFDIGLEISGKADAFREMLANMSHGAKIATPGTPEHDLAIKQVIFHMLTIPREPCRRNFEHGFNTCG